MIWEIIFFIEWICSLFYMLKFESGVAWNLFFYRWTYILTLSYFRFFLKEPFFLHFTIAHNVNNFSLLNCCITLLFMTKCVNFRTISREYNQLKETKKKKHLTAVLWNTPDEIIWKIIGTRKFHPHINPLTLSAINENPNNLLNYYRWKNATRDMHATI